VHISKNEHVFESILAPTRVTAPAFKFLRISECAEEDVPKRDVREIICVMTELMMNAMRFGPLEDETEPRRSFDVPMIEEFANGDENSVIASGADAAAE
jgi:hypothetical protein